jgi:hypothetical protein
MIEGPYGKDLNLGGHILHRAVFLSAYQPSVLQTLEGHWASSSFTTASYQFFAAATRYPEVEAGGCDC